MSKDYTLFHREENRLADYALLDTLVWAPSIDAWVSADPATIRTILLNPNFVVIDFRTIYSTLSNRFGIDFGPTIRVLDYVALGLSGKEHRDVRKRETLFLKGKTDAAIAAFCKTLDERLAVFFSGADGGDMALEIVAPSIASLFSILSGNQAVDGQEPSLSQVFDRMLSLNRRRNINERIRELVDNLSTKEVEDGALMQISLAVVGADSIFASFCQSILSVLHEHKGKRMSDMAWPKEMPNTGVPYVDRFASAEVEIDGHRIGAGDRVRLYIEATMNAPDAPLSGFFGIGAHVCLGKIISMRAWKALVQRFAGIDAKVRPSIHEYRRSDFLFNAPARLQVRISHE